MGMPVTARAAHKPGRAREWAEVSPWVASAAVVGKPVPDWFAKYRRMLWVVDAACVIAAVASTFTVLFPGGAHLAGVLLLDYRWLVPGIVIGWILGSRAAADAYAAQLRRQQQKPKS